MALNLDPPQMQVTLNKNLAISFGLTLAVGLPFSRPILAPILRLRAQTEALLPDRFRWYELDHLHVTVMAPLRGRYREGPPLQRHELPADSEGFFETLNQCFTAMEPFHLSLDRLRLTADGRLLALGADPSHVRRRVAERLASIPGMDQPKGSDGWHATLGYLQTPTPFATEAEQADFEVDWAELQESLLGVGVVDRVWLVHYANRTLSRIVGKAPLLLGRPNTLTPDSFLAALGIGL
jgi:hypothetical protein